VSAPAYGPVPAWAEEPAYVPHAPRQRRLPAWSLAAWSCLLAAAWAEADQALIARIVRATDGTDDDTRMLVTRDERETLRRGLTALLSDYAHPDTDGGRARRDQVGRTLGALISGRSDASA
jgi:hypothetical protein